jgi:hypothetical protein
MQLDQKGFTIGASLTATTYYKAKKLNWGAWR